MDIYTTGSIRGVVRALSVPKPFLLDLFFRNVIESNEAEILFDVEIKKRRLAPYVAPHVPGKIVAQNGFRTDRFTPAYVKDKRPLDPKRPLKRAMGEQVGGAIGATPAQREAAILANELQDQVDNLTRRLEHMAADALDDGVVTVTGDGFPAVSVDFGRPAGLTVALADPNEWNDTGISPVSNLQTHMTTFLQQSSLPATDVVFTPTAWSDFQKDPTFKTAVDMTLRGTTASVDFIPTPTEGGQLVGYLNSQTKLWLYANQYDDDAGAAQSYLADNTVLLGNSTPDGAQTRAFGCIQDPELGYVAEMYGTKSWTEKDPGQRLILMQSAPLTILSRPAATMRIRTRAS